MSGGMDTSHSAAHVSSGIWITTFSRAAIRQGDLRAAVPSKASVSELTISSEVLEFHSDQDGAAETAPLVITVPDRRR
jgi:hypothetical protein